MIFCAATRKHRGWIGRDPLVFNAGFCLRWKQSFWCKWMVPELNKCWIDVCFCGPSDGFGLRSLLGLKGNFPEEKGKIQPGFFIRTWFDIFEASRGCFISHSFQGDKKEMILHDAMYDISSMNKCMNCEPQSFWMMDKGWLRIHCSSRLASFSRQQNEGIYGNSPMAVFDATFLDLIASVKHKT